MRVLAPALRRTRKDEAPRRRSILLLGFLLFAILQLLPLLFLDNFLPSAVIGGVFVVSPAGGEGPAAVHPVVALLEDDDEEKPTNQQEDSVFPKNVGTDQSFLPQRKKRLDITNEEVVQEIRKWKDPKYSIDRIKIYYYDLPEKFNEELVRRSLETPPKIRDPLCNESFYSAENTLSQYFKNSPVRTKNASEADFFYVPILTTCFLMMNLPNDIEKSGRFFAEAMDHVMNDYPYWNNSDGRDHIFMFAQGFGARHTGDWTKYRNAVFLVHNGDYSEPHFSPAKDIVVPPDISHYVSPIWHDRKPAIEDKALFGFFGGSVVSTNITDHRGSNYSGGVRQYFQKYLAKTKGYKITGTRSATYTDDISHSIFCMCPHGWHKWSPRPTYSILLGCIPAVVSEEQLLPFENLIDFNKVSLWIRPKDITQLDAKLHGLHPTELQKLMDGMEEVWQLFWYGDDGLASEAVLYSLYQKLGLSRQYRKFI